MSAKCILLLVVLQASVGSFEYDPGEYIGDFWMYLVYQRIFNIRVLCSLQGMDKQSMENFFKSMAILKHFRVDTDCISRFLDCSKVSKSKPSDADQLEFGSQIVVYCVRMEKQTTGVTADPSALSVTFSSIEETTITPESKTKTIEETTITPESKTKTIEETTITPESKTKTIEETTITPESKTKTTVEATTITPECETKTTVEGTTITPESETKTTVEETPITPENKTKMTVEGCSCITRPQSKTEMTIVDTTVSGRGMTVEETTVTTETTVEETTITPESKTEKKVDESTAISFTSAGSNDGKSISQPRTTVPFRQTTGLIRTTKRIGFCKGRRKMGFTWPDTEGGKKAAVSCPDNTTGFAHWYCNTRTLQFEPDEPLIACTPLCAKEDNQSETWRTFKRPPTPSSPPPRRFGRDDHRWRNDIPNCDEINETNLEDIMKNVSRLRENFRKLRNKGPGFHKMDGSRMKKFVKNAVGTFSNFLKSLPSAPEEGPPPPHHKKMALEMISCVEDMGWLGTYAHKDDQNRTMEKVEADNIVLKSFVLNETSNRLFFRILNQFVGAIVLPGKSALNQSLNPCQDPLEFGVGIAIKGMDELIVDVDENSTEPDICVKSEVVGVSLTECSSSYSMPLGQKAIIKLVHKQPIVKGSPICAFLMLNNGSSGSHGPWHTDGCRVKKHTQLYTICECDHLTNFAIIMDTRGSQFSKTDELALHILSIICCSLSVVALSLTIITFTSVRCLRTKRNIITCNLAACLLIMNILVQTALERYDTLMCQMISGVLQYVVLSAFMWMLMEAVLLYKMVIVVFETKELELRWFYPISYGMPLVIVASSAVKGGILNIRDRFCWPSFEAGQIWAIVGPIILILLINTVVFGMTLRAAARITKTNIYGEQSLKQKKDNLKKRLRGAASLTIILGLTWFIGFFIQPELKSAAYIFVILNGLQGFFLFTTQILMCSHIRPVAFAFYKQGLQRISSVTTWRTDLRIRDSRKVHPDGSVISESSFSGKLNNVHINIVIDSPRSSMANEYSTQNLSTSDYPGKDALEENNNDENLPTIYV